MRLWRATAAAGAVNWPGYLKLPFIVRDMSDHEAVQAMKDSNKQRDQTLPSELAALLDLEVEDIKHQGGRLKNVAEGDIGKRSVEIVGEAHDMNYKKVMRYLRLNSLVPELLDKQARQDHKSYRACLLEMPCSANAGLNEFNQLFHIVKFIIVTKYSLTVIKNASFFICFKTIQQMRLPIPFGKQGKGVGLDFIQ